MISQIADSQKLTTDPAVINLIDLYTPEATSDISSLNNFLNNIETLTFVIKSSLELDKSFVLEEVVNSIQSMKNGKSPGPDGYLDHEELLRAVLYHICYSLLLLNPCP